VGIPTAIQSSSVDVCNVVVTSGISDLTNYVIDNRTVSHGGSGGGGGSTGSTADHGELTGLGDDDHQHYSLVNGARDYTGIVSYNAAKTFNDDAQLVDKKYVDDALPIFGSEYDYAESEGESSTTANTYQQKLRLTTGTVSAGTYRICWSFEYNSSLQLTDSGYNVEVDSSIVIADLPSPPQRFYSDGSYFGVSGFKHMALSNASHTIDVNYIADLNGLGATTYIRRARLEIWRVS
jgi:hypothetical protein